MSTSERTVTQDWWPLLVRTSSIRPFVQTLKPIRISCTTSLLNLEFTKTMRRLKLWGGRLGSLVRHTALLWDRSNLGREKARLSRSLNMTVNKDTSAVGFNHILPFADVGLVLQHSITTLTTNTSKMERWCSLIRDIKFTTMPRMLQSRSRLMESSPKSRQRSTTSSSELIAPFKRL